ncbi:MAG: NAD(P)/FAD-dependent oxidoreductase [Candidatus Methylomirabilia bacterium]
MATNDIYDVVVIGGGVVGASAAFHLKKLGCPSVALVERGQICTGGTAKSCAIIRSHYSVPTNTQLTLKSLEIFTNFAEYLGDGEADCGFVNSGYLILTPEGNLAEKLSANLAMQTGVGAETFAISRAEAQKLHPWLALDDVAAIGHEPNSGYADPYLTTTSFVRAARRLGAVVKTDCPVTGVLTQDGRVTGIRTTVGEIHARTVLAAIGPWTALIARALDIELPLEVSRHIVLTFKAADAYAPTLPIVKDLTTANKMYFRPSSGGVVLVGSGDHGDPVDTPDGMSENATLDFVALQSGQIARRMPGFADAELSASWAGPYDITPDWNPVLGPVPGLDGLHIAYGFSGHGFKLAPAVGKVLAQGALGLEQDIDSTPYRLSRFTEGELLLGAYGIGSIS